MPSFSDADRLDSWKEIASYLRRSVRTVRRWEADEGLPVHRQMHRSGATVYAYRAELDAWLRRGEAAPLEAAAPSRSVATPTPPGEVSSIAVLPFSFIGPGTEDTYLADGFTDEVIADLSGIRRLRVISRTSSMTLKGTRKDARAIGRELGVAYLLEGTVRRYGSRLRIATRLIEAARDDRVWAEKYEGTIEDVFAIQERIARRIVGALELRLTAAEDERITQRPINDLIAWRCLLEARQASLRWRPDAIDQAIRRLRDGISVVGDNAELWAALGRAHLQYREAAVDLGEEPIQRAEACLAKVNELDPGSATSRQLRGWIHYAKAEIWAAVRELETALETDWTNPDTMSLLANCYLISGRVGRARPIVGRLLSVDPLTPLTRCMPGWAAVIEGNPEAAIEPYRDMFELDAGNPMARLFYVWILTVNGRQREIRSLVEGFPAELADSPAALVAGLLAATLVGEDPTPFEPTPEIKRLAATTDVIPRFVAQAWALAGDGDRAVRWLDAAVERGFINYPYLARHDPILTRLVDHAPYASLLERVRRLWEAFEPQDVAD